MTLSEEEFYIDNEHKYENKTWQEVRSTAIIVPASYWADLKSALLKYCQRAGNCPEFVEQKIKRTDELIKRNKNKTRGR